MNLAKARLILTAALFLGWLAWLGYAALAKNRGPVVSHVQAAAAAQVVVAELSAGAEGKPAPEVKVSEAFTKGSPAAGTELYIVNLAEAKGFDGPGQYLLLLTGNSTGRAIPINGKDVLLDSVVGLQRSPGYELAGTGSPMIYKMSNEVRAQAKTLFP